MAIVCIICNRFIIGMETIHKLTKEHIGAHTGRLGVKSYEKVLPSEEAIPSLGSTRYVTLALIEEISYWLRHLFRLLHRNATTHGKQENSS